MSLNAERTKAAIANSLSVSLEKVTPEVNIRKELSADSLDMVELIIELENEFHISIPDEQIEKIQTVAEVIEYIEQAVANQILNEALPV